VAHSQGYKWKEISDLPVDVGGFRDRELESLCEVWKWELPRIGENTATNFSAQLAREWAIETGIIEGVYTLDRGITQTLIERGIDSAYIPHDATNRDPELVARIIRAHEEVLEGLFAFVKGERPLTAGYIKELHAALLRDVDVVVVSDPSGRLFETLLEKGASKRMPNNPTRRDGVIHEYCPPEHVASEMDRLIELHHEHERRGVFPHVESAWLHHAFTQIHPFQDGNGRVARALASLVFIKAGFFPLVVNRDDRDKYIDALEEADNGALSELVELFAHLQKRAITKAIGMAVDIVPAESVEEALKLARDLLVKLGKVIPSDESRAKDYADELTRYVSRRLNEISGSFRSDITAHDPTFELSSYVGGSGALKGVQEVASKFKYEPNMSVYHNVANACFLAGRAVSTVIISLHGVGGNFRGVLAALAYFEAGNNAILICDDIFRITYLDSLDELIPRFQKWLDKALIEGLAQWRRTLV